MLTPPPTPPSRTILCISIIYHRYILIVSKSSQRCRVSTKPVISHTLPVPEDSTQPTPFCLAQRTQHVHTATCNGRQHMNTPGRTSLVENCWKKLGLYHFSPQALNTLGKVWSIPAGGAMKLDPTCL